MTTHTKQTTSVSVGKNPVFAQTMMRIKDPEKSRDLYENKLGMKLLTRFDFPSLQFSLYFFAYTQEKVSDIDQYSQSERAKWLWNCPYPTLELTHNWGN
eukprot:jgi/Galph1/4895/GphlegSOOS_G3594.1